MHRALHIHEVLQVIFENFLPVHDDRSLTFASYESYASFVAGKSTSQTLLSLAVTCRTFLEPALDALWWAMDDLTPLLALLNGYKNIMDGHEDRVSLNVHPVFKTTNQWNVRSRLSVAIFPTPNAKNSFLMQSASNCIIATDPIASSSIPIFKFCMQLVGRPYSRP